MEAVLLVGGLGTRLRPLTVRCPKPMLPVAGVPFVAHQLARAAAAGVDQVVLATSYRPEVFALWATGRSGASSSSWSPRTSRSAPAGRSQRRRALRSAVPTTRSSSSTATSCRGTTSRLSSLRTARPVGGRHAAPRRGGGRARLRLRADRRGRAGDSVPREDARTRRPTRSTPAATSSSGRHRRDPRRAGRVGGARDLPWAAVVGPWCWAYVETRTGSTSAHPAAFVRGSRDLVRGMLRSPALPGRTGRPCCSGAASSTPARS